MAADVCPVTRLRCPYPELCRSTHCARDRGLHPIFERDLTQAEQYALAMDEKRKEVAP